MKVDTVSGMTRLVHILAFAAILLAGGTLLAAPGSASAVRGIDEKSPHIIAVSQFGSPLLPGKVTLLSTDARRVLLSISSAKILPVLVERKPEPKSWLSAVAGKFEDNALFEEVAPYLWFVAAFFVLTLMARREVRNAAIPAPRPKRPPGPWSHRPRQG
jgi:hypothetical protein